MHVMHQRMKWEDYLPLIEFDYNNGYQESLKMIPFEALYGRQRNILISWNNPVDRITPKPELLKEMDQQIVKIKQNMKIAHDRQKRYEDKNRAPREFKVGDHVYL
jgi:hypothetical protein